MYKIKRFSSYKNEYSEFEDYISYKLPHEFYKLEKILNRYLKNSIYPTDHLPVIIPSDSIIELNKSKKFDKDNVAIIYSNDDSVTDYLLTNKSGKYKWSDKKIKGSFRTIKDALLNYLDVKMDSKMKNLDSVIMTEYESKGYEYNRIHNKIKEASIDELANNINKEIYSYLKYSYFIKDKL